MKSNFLALLALLSFGAQGVSAEEIIFEQGNFKYQVTSDSTVAVAGPAQGCTETVLVVPQKVKHQDHGYTVTSVGEYAFRWSNVTSVTLPNTIDSLQYCAFYSADKLSYIGLPATLKYMGDYCFASTKLTTVIMPEELEVIPGSCFFGVSTLQSITFPSTLKKIGNSCFYKCSGLTQINIPEGCEEIGKAFLYCTSLQQVHLPSTLKVLGMGAFNHCTALSSIQLPSALQEIGEECFFECPALTELQLPRALHSIGGGAFAKSGISRLTLEDGNVDLRLIDGCVYDADGRILLAAPMKDLYSVTVPEGCVGIGSGAFWGSELTQITLPQSLRAIDSYAFCQSQLASIAFPYSLRYMGEQALAATNLIQVELPDNMPEVGNALLAGCTRLTEVTIPSVVNFISNRTFWGCTDLVRIRCLGSTPPEIDEWFDTDESPFQRVSGATLSVPVGCRDAYAATTWGHSEAITTIIEGETAVLEPTLITSEGQKDAQGGIITLSSITFHFDEPVTIAQASPRVMLMIENSLTGREDQSATSWKLEAAGSDATLSPLDAAGQPLTLTFTKGFTYYLLLPAGVIQSSEAATEYLELAIASGEPDPMEVLSITPADGAVLEQVAGIEVRFDCPVKVASNVANVIVTRSNGDALPIELWFAQPSDTADNIVSLYPCTLYGYTAYLAPFALEGGEEYSISIPKGFALAAENNAPSPALTLTYVGLDTVPNIHPNVITPANGSDVQTLSALNFTFDEELTVLTQTPRITLICEGEPVEVTCWFAQVSSKSPQKLTIRPGELDGSYFIAEELNLDPTHRYQLQLPAGIVKGKTTLGRSAPITLDFNQNSSAIGLIHADSLSRTTKSFCQGSIRITRAGHVYNAAGVLIK